MAPGSRRCSRSYLPAAIGLQAARREFAGVVAPIPGERLTDTWYEDRERVDKLVAVEDESKEGIQAALAILAPVAASLATILLPEK